MKRLDSLALSNTIDLHEEGLKRLRRMWLDPKVLFYEDKIPRGSSDEKTVFLAGPTSRDGIPDYMWRKDAVHFLRVHGCTGNILVPEPRGYSYLAEDCEDDFTDAERIYEWEHEGIRNATYPIVWIPRNMQQLLGLTTNREIGQLMGRAEHETLLSKNLFIGWPQSAKKIGSLEFELRKAEVGFLKGEHFTSLEELCKEIGSRFENDDIPF